MFEEGLFSVATAKNVRVIAGGIFLLFGAAVFGLAVAGLIIGVIRAVD